MNRRLSTLLLTAACAAAPLALFTTGPANAQSVTRASGELVLSIGRGQLINLPATMKDVFVADDKIADVQVKSNHQLYVFAKGPGETSIYASNAAGQVIWSTNVRVGSNIDNVGQMLKVAMPEAKIAVATMGINTVLLTGTVASPEDSAEAQRLVQAYMGKEANVIARLKTATPLQVMLQVRIAEVSRTLSRTLNPSVTTSNNANGFQYAIGQGRSLVSPTGIYYPTVGVGVGNTPYGLVPIAANATTTNPQGLTSVPGSGVSLVSTLTTLAAQTQLGPLSILATLDAGEQVGLVTTLAQPNLTAVSGETADFLAGGEFPIPSSSGLGTVAIEFKKFGVSLAYTPTVLSDGRISLRVRPEVSELSSQGSVTLNGFTIPALTVRRAETTVELGSGQSFMIGGLLSNKANHTIQKMPGAGDVPILGALFRSTSFQRDESELVIVVTPYLVKPVNDGDIKLPTDGFQSPDAIQQVLGNMTADGKSGASHPHPTSATQAAATAKIGLADKPVISTDLPALAPSQPQPQPQPQPRQAAATVTSTGSTGGGSDKNASGTGSSDRGSSDRGRTKRSADKDTKAPGFSLN